MCYLTDHAVQRTKERVGLPKRSAEKNAQKALENGIRHCETKGSLNRYITALYWKQKTANNIRIYCNNVYIFNNSVAGTKRFFQALIDEWNFLVAANPELAAVATFWIA